MIELTQQGIRTILQALEAAQYDARQVAQEPGYLRVAAAEEELRLASLMNLFGQINHPDGPRYRLTPVSEGE
ncbi:hypothetical protein [Nitrolancea hollandica]|uniref:Uncharacterized protein n=1 Tax=Nitrolancea hollandica Lb TaxID=1129897 RepID=I4EKZ6_9BACT|nr:hypothetical protein [Nitrolancea hollandica]CCF85358.1 hypothetical protein NITHO_4880003 [Nitrolancea hollandica Lb]